MKVYIAILGLLAAAVGVRGESLDSTLAEAQSTDHGLTLTTNLTSGSLVWTNSAKAPVKLNSILLDMSGVNTVSVSLVRFYDVEYQRRASEVITNEFGDVVTNVYNQVTNVVASVSSNNLVSAIVTNDAWLGINHLSPSQRLPEGLYSRRGDVWILQSGTSSSPAVIDFSE